MRNYWFVLIPWPKGSLVKRRLHFIWSWELYETVHEVYKYLFLSILKDSLLGISVLSMYKHIWLKKNNYRITAQGCSPLTFFQNGYENTRHKSGCFILSILYLCLCRIVAGWASSTKRQADMHERSGAFRFWIDVTVLISLVVSCCFCKWPMELVAWSDWTNNALPNVIQMFNADASFPALHYFSNPMGSTQIHLTVVHNHGGK